MTIQQHASFDSSAAELNATSKLVKAWESKNAKNAAKAGGISMMALSLAACGGSSTTTTATTDTTTTDTTTDTTTTVVTTDPAALYSLTVSGTTGSADVLTGGSGDDTFVGTLAGSFEGSDVLDGGAGTDTLLNSLPTVTAATSMSGANVSNVEVVSVNYVHDGGAADVVTLDLAGFQGVTKVVANKITNTGSTADSVLTISGLNMTTAVDIEVVGGDTGANNSSVDITATYQTVTGSADSSNLLLNGAAANVVTVAGIETFNITATSTETSASSTGYSAINSLQVANAKSIVVSSDSSLTIGALNAAATVSIDNSGSAGKLILTGETAATTTTFLAGSGGDTLTTASTGIVNFTGGAGNDTYAGAGGNSTDTVDMGAGNDTVTVGAATNLTAVDSIVGGAGKDTIVVTDVTLNATIQTAIAEATGFEVLATSATAEKTVDFSALTLFEEVAITAAGSATAATTGTNAAAGTDAIGVTSDNTGNTLSITEGQTGQAGSVSAATVAGKAGGDSLQIAASSDGASDSFTINLTGNADITGGAGGGLTDQTHDATGGAGGMAINAASLEALTIHVISNEVTADTVTIDGGAGGAQVSTNADTGDTVGADGVAITLSANATLTLTDDVTTSAKDYNDVTIGTVKGTNVVVDGSALRGDLTVSAIDGNVTVSGGAGADTLTGGTGADTIRGNAGDDTITGAGGKDTLYGGAGSDTFDIVTGNASSAVTAVTDIIMDFANGLSGDTINLEFDGAVIGDKASTDVSGAVSGTTDLNAVTADGIITLSGTGVSLVDTAAEVIDIFELMDATNTEEFGAVVVGDDTYVIGINSSNAVLEVVFLDGMNDATSISLVDAAGGILIA